MLKDYKLPPHNNQPPQRAVIFLHGLGDSGAGGLLSIGQIWQPHLPDCLFLCPDAPFAFDMAPPDFGGRQWFSLQTFDPVAMLHGAKTATPYLNDYIDHVMVTYNLTPDRIALVGFSQGTIMALYTALRRNQSVACIVGYSGLLIGGETLAAEKKSAPPILLVHGQMDDVVPFAAMAVAEQGLQKAGLSVKTLACPYAAHTIDDNGLREGLIFIKRAWNMQE